MKQDIEQDDFVSFEDPLSNYEPIQYESELQRALAEETIAAINSYPFVQMKASSTVRQGIETLHQMEVSSLLVVDDAGQVVGIFTERDVLEKVAERYTKVADQPISGVMTKSPTVVYETDPAAMALAAIAVAGHRHVPVLTIHHSLHGIVSPRRVFEFMEKHFEN